MVRFPQLIRRQEIPFGSATLATSQRVGIGSVLTTEDVDVTRDETKSFFFRGNQRGSWFIDGSPIGTQNYAAIAEGTFPAGQGSVTVRSTTEAFRLMRARVRAQVAGSFSVYYGGQSVMFR